ncbi:hypothetical protein OPT61_g5223 [Boeremia exigua]|uniref:Uncharacterized protein n=1 Tax=Boeremia exigua TaxID=749465 RepID=A0ACC2IB02_9PLEO|nr:hypothetical protein OPT61_g5223 [Boeremia exigua]
MDIYALTQCDMALYNATSELKVCTRNFLPSERDITPEVFCAIPSGRHLTFEDLGQRVMQFKDLNRNTINKLRTTEMRGFKTNISELEQDSVLYSYIFEDLDIANLDYTHCAQDIDDVMRSTALKMMHHPENATILTCDALSRTSAAMKNHTNSVEHVALQRRFSELVKILDLRNDALKSHLNKTGSFLSRKPSDAVVADLNNLIQSQEWKRGQVEEWQSRFSEYLESTSKAEKDLEKLRDRWCDTMPANSSDNASVLCLWEATDLAENGLTSGLCEAYAISRRTAKMPPRIKRRT